MLSLDDVEQAIIRAKNIEEKRAETDDKEQYGKYTYYKHKMDNLLKTRVDNVYFTKDFYFPAKNRLNVFEIGNRKWMVIGGLGRKIGWDWRFHVVCS